MAPKIIAFMKNELSHNLVLIHNEFEIRSKFPLTKKKRVREEHFITNNYNNEFI